MHITVDALLIIGIIVNLVKAGDLILRPHQLKWFQDRIEHLTLWLDFTKPLKALKTLIGEEGRLGLLILACVPAVVLFAILGAPRDVGVTFLTFLNFTMLVLLIKSGLATTEWLFANRRFIVFLKKFVLLNVGQAGALICLVFVARSTAYFFNHSEEHTYYIYLGFVLALILVILVLLNLALATVWLACGVTILASTVLLLLEMLLKLARGIAWRIVEYNKGAFAAIILFMTVALGLIDFYLRLKK